MKKKNGSLKLITNLLSLYGVTFSFIFTPIAGAADVKSNIVDESNNWVGNINAAIQYGAQMYGKYNQMSAMQRPNPAMQALQVKPIPANYFPKCKISPAKDNFPKNVCEPIVIDGNPQSAQAQMQMATQMMSIAEAHQNFYDQLLSEAQNTKAAVGVQCLKNAYREELNGMQKKIDYLTNLSTQVQEMDKRTKAELQLMRNEMDNLNYELTGNSKNPSSDAQSSLDLKAKYFNNAACDSVIPGAVFTSGTGIKGVKDFMTTANDGRSLSDTSSNMIANEGKYKRDLEKQISIMQSNINKYGIEDWQNTFNLNELTRGGLTKFAGITEVVQTEANKIMVAKERAAKYLKDNVDYNLPALDGNFASNVGTFATDAATYFKKKSIEACVTGDLGLSYDQVIGLINPDGQGTKINMREGLKDILESDGFISDKLNDIAKLDKTFGLDNVQFKLAKGGGTKTYTPYVYFKEIVKTCEDEYAHDKTFSAKGESTTSDKQKVEKAQKYINEIVKLERSFSSDLAKAVNDEIINCDRGSLGSGGCNAETMNVESTSFCLNTASTCASNVAQCVNHATNAYNKVRKDLEQKVNNYNAKIAAMVVKKNDLLKSEAFKAVFNSEWYGKYFNNSPYQLPENLTVSNPELAMSEYGFMTHGGDGLDFLDAENPENLPAQLDKLKEMIEKQQNEITKVVEDYIAEQRKAMAQNKAGWDGIKEKCNNSLREYQVAAAKYNQEQMKQNAEVKQAVSTWCTRYNGRPICGGTNSPSALMKDALKISSYINPAALDAIRDAEEACLSQEDGMDSNRDYVEPETQSAIEPIVDLCEKLPDSTPLSKLMRSTVNGSMESLDDMVSYLNKGTKETDSDIDVQSVEDYINWKTDEVPAPLKKIMNTNEAGRMIEAMRLANESKDDSYTCGDFKKALESECKGEGKSCTAETMKGLKHALPYSSEDATMKAAIGYNNHMRTLEVNAIKFKRLASKLKTSGEGNQWPSCTAIMNQNRTQVGESVIAPVDKLFMDSYNRVMGE